MTTTAAVFMSGNSQAVRLPKAFQFKSKAVEIYRRGDEVVLREKKQTLGEALGNWPRVPEDEASEWDHIMKEANVQAPQERDWNDLLGGQHRS
jgi:antitoxin VapB